jgi:hypothetical protein
MKLDNERSGEPGGGHTADLRRLILRDRTVTEAAELPPGGLERALEVSSDRRRLLQAVPAEATSARLEARHLFGDEVPE